MDNNETKQTSHTQGEKKYTDKDLKKAIQMARELKDGKELFEIEGILGCTEVCMSNVKMAYSEEQIINSLDK